MVGRGSDTNLSRPISDTILKGLEGPPRIEPHIDMLLQGGYHYVVPLHNSWGHIQGIQMPHEYIKRHT